MKDYKKSKAGELFLNLVRHVCIFIFIHLLFLTVIHSIHDRKATARHRVMRNKKEKKVLFTGIMKKKQDSRSDENLKQKYL